MTTHAATEWIQLDYSADGKVVVTPADQDRFVLTVQQAADACSAAQQSVKFSYQFRESLLPKLAEWLGEHDAQIHKAFLAYSEGGLLFVVVRREVAFDGEFTDALTALDVAIARAPGLDLVKLDVLALPRVSDEGAKSYLDPDGAMEFTRAKRQ